MLLPCIVTMGILNILLGQSGEVQIIKNVDQLSYRNSSKFDEVRCPQRSLVFFR
jgi:hypothetical protein